MPHCNTLQHAATRCNALQHTATHISRFGLIWYATLQHAARCNTLQHAATHCNTLQHTTTHCNTLQHTAFSRGWVRRSIFRFGVLLYVLAKRCVCGCVLCVLCVGEEGRRGGGDFLRLFCKRVRQKIEPLCHTHTKKFYLLIDVCVW